MKYRIVVSLAAFLSIVPALTADNSPFNIIVTGGKEDLKNAIAVVALPADYGKLAQKPLADVAAPDGKQFVAQIEPWHKLVDGKTPGPELAILIPELKAGEKLDLKVRLVDIKGEGKESFRWTEVDGMEQLLFNNRPILRYFHKKFDASLTAKGKETTNPTTKPYHHLFASDGKTIVTNSNQGQFPHHRGIFYGFNNISYEGKKVDVWHCRNGEHTAHEKIIAAEAGPLFGRHALQIAWNGTDGKPFANERRELTAYNIAGGTLIDFSSELTTRLDKVRLDGDPQHAGFHFRANSTMEKNTKETYFLRPDGKGKLGEEKNWVPKGNGGPVNLPWDAMSFVLDGKRYTVVYLDHPNNPKEARQSERNYGRIGTYFEYDLTPDRPLKVQYRLWFQEGELTSEQCAALSRAFVDRPTAKLDAR
jgi:hypothetical protein